MGTGQWRPLDGCGGHGDLRLRGRDRGGGQDLHAGTATIGRRAVPAKTVLAARVTRRLFTVRCTTVIQATRHRGATVRLEDLREACLVEVTAQRRRDCACPCFRAHPRGACRIWIWPPETYYLALVGPQQRARGVPICQSCVAALRDESIVTLTPTSRLRTVLEAVCRQAGFVPRIVAETSDLNVMLALVAEKVGIAMLPRSGLEGAAAVTAIDLTHPRVERRIVLVWRADNTSPACSNGTSISIMAESTFSFFTSSFMVPL